MFIADMIVKNTVIIFFIVFKFSSLYLSIKFQFHIDFILVIFNLINKNKLYSITIRLEMPNSDTCIK